MRGAAAHRHLVVPRWHPMSCGMLRKVSHPAIRSHVWSFVSGLGNLVLNLDCEGLAKPRESWLHLHMPYVGHVRWSAALEGAGALPPWRKTEESTARRVTLASFCGSTQGSAQNRPLRLKIAALCASEPRSCEPLLASQGPLRGSMAPLQLRQRSVFCLEPPGFGPIRRSTMDVLLLGCIPVLFYTAQRLRGFLPTHVGPWLGNASINIEPATFLRADFELLPYLRAVPKARVAHMQETISANAHSLTYGRDDLRGDALDVLLAELLTRSRARWRRE